MSLPREIRPALASMHPNRRSAGAATDAGRWWRRGVRNFTVIGGLVAVMALLLNATDIVRIGVTLRDVPAAIAISVAVHVPQVVMTALAWRTLVPLDLRPSVTTMSLLRWYRESAGALLPAGGLVGQVAAARLLMRRGVPGNVAGATATIDLTLEVVSQALFTVAGLAFLLGRTTGGGATGFATVGVGVSVAVGCALALLGVQWLLRLQWDGARLAPLVARWPALGLHRLGSLYRAVRHLHARRPNLAAGLCWHGAAWVLGAMEIVGVLGLLGHKVSFAEGLIVESVAQALRNAGFMLPGAVGLQEAALVGGAALVGVPPPLALTVALVRRARELLLSVAGLLAWHRAEAAWRATRHQAAADPC
jgi:putative membrane protein